MLKIGAGGEVVRLSMARIELGANDYTLRGQLDNQDAPPIGIFQAPGANALTVRDAVIAKMEELKTRFPPGLTYRSDYDTTVFVRDSIRPWVQTPCMETILLVVGRHPVPANLACLDHSADRRAHLSVVGFSRCAVPLRFLHQHPHALRACPFAIGIVVDDAIVVVENVERNIEEGRPTPGGPPGDAEIVGPDRRDRARLVPCLCRWPF